MPAVLSQTHEQPAGQTLPDRVVQPTKSGLCHLRHQPVRGPRGMPQPCRILLRMSPDVRPVQPVGITRHHHHGLHLRPPQVRGPDTSMTPDHCHIHRRTTGAGLGQSHQSIFRKVNLIGQSQRALRQEDTRHLKVRSSGNVLVQQVQQRILSAQCQGLEIVSNRKSRHCREFCTFKTSIILCSLPNIFSGNSWLSSESLRHILVSVSYCLISADFWVFAEMTRQSTVPPGALCEFFKQRSHLSAVR